MTRRDASYQTQAPDPAEVEAMTGLVLLDFGTNWCGHCIAARAPVDAWFDAHAGADLLRVEDGPGRRLGRAYRESGELTLARQALERGLSAFESAGDERGLAATQDDLGRVLWLLGERAHASALLRAALRSRKQRSDARSLALSLGNLALVWDEQGNAARSERALSMVGELCEHLADPRARCDALLVSGRLSEHHAQHENARARFRGDEL